MNAALSQSLDGAVALVTGAGGGIGRAICAALRAAGACVIATDICDAPKDLRVDTWFQCDVTSVEDWTHLVHEIRREFGHLDCVVNNAGISLVEKIEDTSLEQWRRVSSVNVESILLGMRASLPLLRESGNRRVGGASIVNISSTAGLRGVAFNAAYSASKGAMTLLSKSAAKEFAALKYLIRVNSVHPGVVETRMLDSILTRYVEVGLVSSTEQQKAAWDAGRPMGRSARSEEIAAGVVFLCSSASSFMTGSELVIDGGGTA